MNKRPHGTGGIHQLPDGRFRVSFQSKGRRYWRRARTQEEAEQRLKALISNVHRGRTDGLRAHTRRARAEEWIGVLVAEAEGHPEWTQTHFAKVIVAQLSPSRIKRDVFGPCVYCGTWIAGTIDHVVPRERGGTDEPDNLVSACWSCNSRKGAREGWIPRAATIDSLPVSQADSA